MRGDTRVHEYSNQDEQRRKLRELLDEYMELKLGTADITVLSFRRFEDSVLQGNTQLGKHAFTDGVPTVRAFRFSTVQGFKGLESRCVILCDLEPGSIAANRANLYVGMTRARVQLDILTNNRKALLAGGS